MRNARPPWLLPSQNGTATLELAMLFPILVLVSLALVQIVIFLQSSTVTQYAAFASSRAFQVYGDRTLDDISYPKVREIPYTHGEQSIAEAAAEKIIFESLLWEQQKIFVRGDSSSLDRYYNDGIQKLYDGMSSYTTPGSVQIDFLGCQAEKGCPKGVGTKITYCLPIVFPGIDVLFGKVKAQWSCRGKVLGREYNGIAISSQALLLRETSIP